MKKFSILFVLAVIASQVYGQHVFNNVALENTHNRNMISFSLPSEANVTYYRVEASNDSKSFEIVGTVRSSGNSVLSKEYRYELYGVNYKYYRIGRVGMNGSLQYSDVVAAPKPVQPAEESKLNSANMPAGNAITQAY